MPPAAPLALHPEHSARSRPAMHRSLPALAGPTSPRRPSPPSPPRRPSPPTPPCRPSPPTPPCRPSPPTPPCLPSHSVFTHHADPASKGVLRALAPR
eukprot:4792576-Pleurochrysis_carterae.AAC.2